MLADASLLALFVAVKQLGLSILEVLLYFELVHLDIFLKEPRVQGLRRSVGWSRLSSAIFSWCWLHKWLVISIIKETGMIFLNKKVSSFFSSMSCA